MNVMVMGILLAGATFVSEDAATLAAGSMVLFEQMPAWAAILWVAAGIWAGDLVLFAIGRGARCWPPAERWVSRRWPAERVRVLEARISRGAAWAILGSRFLPGTRVALYIAAGMLRVRTSTFAFSAAVASIVWTSAIVLTIGAVGRW